MLRLVQDVQDQGQDDESSTDPLGSLSQLSIEALSIATGQESLSNLAANAVGQTGILAGLEQNSQNNSQTAEKLKNGDEDNSELHNK